MKTTRLFLRSISPMILLLFMVTSCKKDDDTIIEEPQQEFPADYLVLKALYDANTGNALNWDFDDLTMKSWDGVTTSGEKVTKLNLFKTCLLYTSPSPRD